MQFLRVETAGDVRQWDTYIVPVPDDWDDDADDRDARLRDLIAEGKGKHEGTEREHTSLPDDFVINEVDQATERDFRADFHV
ncbi:hypothetical protein D7D52_34715 [Nocardia yunnanensis]|uniref:Uncharacterized protein n=2 Tax=Nocardia yunnanensis TaxID=2382165 RepID=A0A386ZKY8_9NOCA|nr:hypothetical protein D7D52_34715 [Nocardia yunnanensis]